MIDYVPTESTVVKSIHHSALVTDRKEIVTYSIFVHHYNYMHSKLTPQGFEKLKI